jgi:hypothetical protein
MARCNVWELLTWIAFGFTIGYWFAQINDRWWKRRRPVEVKRSRRRRNPRRNLDDEIDAEFIGD